MTGIIVIPPNEPWSVANRAFRMLLDRTSSRLTLDDDRQKLFEAKTFQLLVFDRLPMDQAIRIALAMEVTADEMRGEFERTPGADAWTLGFAERLAVLEMHLHDVHE